MKHKILGYILLLTLALCQLSQGISAQSVTDSTSAESINADNDSLMYSHPTYIYDSLGKKDPFQSLVPVAEDENIIKDLFSYEDATILGIVNSEQESYALVTDKNASSYVLLVGDRVFGGYVNQITDDAIILDIVKYARAMTIIMRLESSKNTVYEEIDGESTIRSPGINITYGKGAGGAKDIIVDEITVNSLDTKFIEEEWFGPVEQDILLEEYQEANIISDLSSVIPLLAPQNQSWITMPTVFEWLNPDDVEYRYSLIIYDDSELKNPVFIQNDINTTSYLLSENSDLPFNKDLFWEVIAYELSGKDRINKKIVMSFKIKGQ